MRKSFWIKTIALCVALIISVYGLVIAPSKIYGKTIDEPQSKIILKLCHLDTFEGGTGSRKQFILSAARSFEKKNEGVLISVDMVTQDNYYAQKSDYDIVSFGLGVKVDNALPIDVKKFYSSGVIDDKVYAVPWAVGGYYIFSKKGLDDSKIIDGAVVSQSEYSSPFVALAISGYTIKNYQVKSPVDAYADFITGQKDTLIGTQRDINRIIARGEDCYITPLNGFSDLIQYASITTSSTAKEFYAQKFLLYLTEDAQPSLKNIGMFSPYVKGIYNDGLLALGEGVKIECTYHAFTDGELLKGINNSLKTDGQSDENKKQIKKLLVYLDKKYRI